VPSPVTERTVHITHNTDPEAYYVTPILHTSNIAYSNWLPYAQTHDQQAPLPPTTVAGFKIYKVCEGVMKLYSTTKTVKYMMAAS
jgi:hypothetical protein